MKTLEFDREKKPNDVMVECADGWLSVYRYCAYCIHCSGIRVGRRVMPSPQKQRLEGVRRGVATDEDLFNAQMMYNTLIRDGSAVECDDDKNEGYRPLYKI